MLHVRDVKMPEGVHATDDGALVVCAVHLPRQDEAPAAAEGAPTEPEVLTAKKEEAPAAEGAAKDAGKKDEKKDEKKK